MDTKLYIKIEECINNRKRALMVKKTDPKIEELIKQRFDEGKNIESLYDTILRYIKALDNPRFCKKDGTVKEAAFYNYAQIDKSTWSAIRWGQATPKKETLLKLIIALRLNEEEANDIMRKASNSLNPKESRDLVILALIDAKCYGYDEVYEVLDEYGKNSTPPFKNIYDSKNMK